MPKWCFLIPIGLLTQGQLNAQIDGEKYALVIGISEYANLRDLQQLDYAAEDAELFSNFLQTAAGGGFKRENIALLTDELATETRVDSVLTQFEQRLGGDDELYFYFSGHGLRQNQGGYYLVTHESNPNNALSKGIEINELITSLFKTPHKNLMVFMDACHSASSFGSAERVNFISEVFVDKWNQQGRKINTSNTVFASSAASQLSYESKFLQHGLFTYYLIEGLRGQADQVFTGNKNGLVTAIEAYQYLLAKVSERSRIEGKETQTPIVSRQWSPDYVLGGHGDLVQQASDLSDVSAKVLGIYEQALLLFEKGNIKLAQELAEVSLGDDSDQDAALLALLARCEIRQYESLSGDLAHARKALEYIERVMKIGDESAIRELDRPPVISDGNRRIGGGDGRLWLQQLLKGDAFRAFDNGDYDKALSLFLLGQKAGLNVNSMVVAFKIGQSAFRLEQYELALEYYDRVIQHDLSLLKNADYGYLQQAVTDIASVFQDKYRNPARPLPMLSKLVLSFPNDLIYRQQELELLIEVRDFEEVEARSIALMKLRKATPEDYYRLAYAQAEVNRPEEALVNVVQALELKEDYYNALLLGGTIRYTQAEQKFKEIDALIDQSSVPYDDTIGAMQQEAKDYLRKAIPYYQKAAGLTTDKYPQQQLAKINQKLWDK